MKRERNARVLYHRETPAFHLDARVQFIGEEHSAVGRAESSGLFV